MCAEDEKLMMAYLVMKGNMIERNKTAATITVGEEYFFVTGNSRGIPWKEFILRDR